MQSGCKKVGIVKTWKILNEVDETYSELFSANPLAEKLGNISLVGSGFKMSKKISGAYCHQRLWRQIKLSNCKWTQKSLGKRMDSKRWTAESGLAHLLSLNSISISVLESKCLSRWAADPDHQAISYVPASLQLLPEFKQQFQEIHTELSTTWHY